MDKKGRLITGPTGHIRVYYGTDTYTSRIHERRGEKRKKNNINPLIAAESAGNMQLHKSSAPPKPVLDGFNVLAKRPHSRDTDKDIATLLPWRSAAVGAFPAVTGTTVGQLPATSGEARA